MSALGGGLSGAAGVYIPIFVVPDALTSSDG